MGYASVDGDIGFMATGKLPIRDGHPDDRGYIKKGWVGKNEWIGYVPQDERPRIINPPKGYLVLANNKFIHPNNKYNLAWSTNPSARAKRIDDFLSAKI